METQKNGKNGHDVNGKLAKDVAKLLDPSAPYGENGINPPKTKGKEKVIDGFEVRTPTFNTLDLAVNGTSIVTFHAWGNKSIAQMLANMMGEKTSKKERDPKDPIGDFLGSIHPIVGHDSMELIDKRTSLKGGKKSFEYGIGPWPVWAEGRIGFPAEGFKKALVSACRYVPGIAMTEANGLVNVIGCEENPEFVEIFGADKKEPKVQMRLDMVRLSGFPPKPDLRFRGFLQAWKATLRLRYNASLVKPNDLANLVQMAGFHIGIGEKRPGKSGGSWGTFSVDMKALGAIEMD